MVGLGLGWLLRGAVSPAGVLVPTDLAGTTVPSPAAQAPVHTPVPGLQPAPRIVGYSVHTVAPAEDVASIAANGGSDVALITSYNRLQAAPQPGRPLIVPQIHGRISALPHDPVLVQRGRSDRPWVALTLDAGGGADPVPSMLQTLRERQVHITFFLTGTWIRENPDLARQIVADGHEVANHSLTHPDFRDLDDAQIVEELARTEQLMRDTTGATTRPLFRPPYGAYDQRVLLTVVREGYLPIYWTLDSLDSVGEPKTPEFLVERVTNQLAPEELRGAIILAHCGSAATAEALPDILDRFEQMGLEVRTLSEVL